MYRPERIVISIAGNYDEDLINLIEEQFGSFQSKVEDMKEAVLQIPEFHHGVSMKSERY